MYDFSPSNGIVPLLEAAQPEDLLIYLKQVKQTDLTGYKRSTLLRRTRTRMQQLRVKHYQDYLAYLQQQPDEATHLLHTVLINYTSFFRDHPVWDHLATTVIPQLIANKAANEPIRIWSAGCASGEESYSLAMLLAEALGTEQFQQRVRIYGTDVDADAIQQARRGYYASDAVATIPPHLLKRYFEPTKEGYCWQRELRRPLLFHTHDLIQAPPLSRIDLLVCRNTLMYLTSETQIRALIRFHFSLQPQGFLLMGQAESLVTRLQQSLFTLVNAKARLFTKVLDTDCDRQWLSTSRYSAHRLNDSLKHGTAAKSSFSSTNPQPQERRQQPVQPEIMQHEIEQLREQVQLLQDDLCNRTQHQVDQNPKTTLQTTQQGLELMNQDIYPQMQIDPIVPYATASDVTE